MPKDQKFTASEQTGPPFHCRLAQVFGPDGQSVATFDATEDSAIASSRASLLADALNKDDRAASRGGLSPIEPAPIKGSENV